MLYFRNTTVQGKRFPGAPRIIPAGAPIRLNNPFGGINMKLWGGRFSKDPDQMVLEFDECVEIGNRMYEQDILGSIAHATMLG